MNPVVHPYQPEAMGVLGTRCAECQLDIFGHLDGNLVLMAAGQDELRQLVQMALSAMPSGS